MFRRHIGIEGYNLKRVCVYLSSNKRASKIQMKVLTLLSYNREGYIFQKIHFQINANIVAYKILFLLQ